MAADDDGTRRSFFKTRLFRAYVVVALLLGIFLLLRWWWPFGGEVATPIEIAVTQEGAIQIAVPETLAADAMCSYHLTTADGPGVSQLLTIMPGVTHQVEASRTFPEGTVMSYAVTCLSGTVSVFESGQITLTTPEKPGQ